MFSWKVYTVITWTFALTSVAISILVETGISQQIYAPTFYLSFLIFRDISMIFVILYAPLVACRFTKALAEKYSTLSIRGRHFHESVMGIIIIAGGTLMVLHGSYLDNVLGAIMIATGGFLIGRDWQDVLKGKFITPIEEGEKDEEKD